MRSPHLSLRSREIVSLAALGPKVGRHPVMLASWYVALKHDFPTRMPSELKQTRKRILFARWLVLTGRLSDFGPLPEMSRRQDPASTLEWRSEDRESLSEAA